MKILVTGADGQLGWEIQQAARSAYPGGYSFFNKQQWDITDSSSNLKILSEAKADILINTAAYTQVDLAENDSNRCFELNTRAPANLAGICQRLGTRYIHISTDYVFHLDQHLPIPEHHPKNPQGVYARSKSEGEDAVLAHAPDSIILRTSWLYSSHGRNFVKTMLRLGRERDSIQVVNDQYGSPTYARDLAQIIQMIAFQLVTHKDSVIQGIYHYCNEGICSWYEFAKEIFQYSGLEVRLDPITTEAFGSAAARPPYSKLDCQKIKDQFQLTIPEWKSSLHNCLDLLSHPIKESTS